MNAAEIISIIKIAFAGRQVVGRIGMICNDGHWDVIARVRNANGEGIANEVLCSLDSCKVAVDVRRNLMLSGL